MSTDKYAKQREKVEFESGVYLRPTNRALRELLAPLANKEFLFPTPGRRGAAHEMLKQIGPSRLVTAITKYQKFINELLDSPLLIG